MTAYSRTTTLSALGDIARVTMTLLPAHGDLDTSRIASGAIRPGEVVEPVAMVASAGGYRAAGTPIGRYQKVAAYPAATYRGMKRYGIAMRPVEVSDTFADSRTDGPIEQVNTSMAEGDYVRVAKSGHFLTTLVALTGSAGYANLKPGALLTWNGAATLPSGVDGTGGWEIAGSNEPIAECVSFKTVGADGGGLLELKLLA